MSTSVTEYKEKCLDPLMRAHEEAMIRFDVEEIISFGIWVYRDLVRDLANDRRRLSTAADIEERTKIERRFRRIFQVWVACSEKIILVADELLSSGHDVAGLLEIKSLVEQRSIIHDNQRSPKEAVKGMKIRSRPTNPGEAEGLPGLGDLGFGVQAPPGDARGQ